MRPNRSVVPAAANGTTTFTGRLGQSCACETVPAERTARSTVPNPSNLSGVIVGLPGSLCSSRGLDQGGRLLHDRFWRAVGAGQQRLDLARGQRLDLQLD